MVFLILTLLSNQIDIAINHVIAREKVPFLNPEWVVGNKGLFLPKLRRREIWTPVSLCLPLCLPRFSWGQRKSLKLSLYFPYVISSSFYHLVKALEFYCDKWKVCLLYSLRQPCVLGAPGSACEMLKSETKKIEISSLNIFNPCTYESLGLNRMKSM